MISVAVDWSLEDISLSAGGGWAEAGLLSAVVPCALPTLQAVAPVPPLVPLQKFQAPSIMVVIITSVLSWMLYTVCFSMGHYVQRNTPVEMGD